MLEETESYKLIVTLAKFIYLFAQQLHIGVGFFFIIALFYWITAFIKFKQQENKDNFFSLDDSKIAFILTISSIILFIIWLILLFTGGLSWINENLE